MTFSRLHHVLYDGCDPTSLPRWQSADDRVMGGDSIAHVEQKIEEDARLACLSGRVSLANRGGFIQMEWPVEPSAFDLSSMSGVYLEVHGNGEAYNVHLRTRQLWLPWQSYRQTFNATQSWQTIYLPFSAFMGYKTSKPLEPAELSKIGIVAIGRAFEVDVCVRHLGLYREDAAVSQAARSMKP